MKKRLLIIFLILILLVTAVFFIIPKKQNKKTEKEEEPEIVEPEPTLNIIDTSLNTRPIAVMINNHNQARPYHSGLQDAYLVYEIIVEGGITRMMALFKDQTTARIGSVRSSRHYYLDYALENDAIYVHFGWSPQAEKDMSLLGVNNINGLYDSAFWRDYDLPINYEHKAVTNIENINNLINQKGYRKTYNSNNVEDELLLDYSIDEISINSSEDSVVANNVIVPAEEREQKCEYAKENVEKNKEE